MIWLKLIAGGAWRIIRAIPWQVYAVACALLLIYAAYAAAVSRGDRQARAELAPLLAQAHADAATRLQQLADAEGRALALDAGLQQCIGTRASMATITSAVLGERDRARAQALRALTATRQELTDAYDTTADRCADQPVPDAVVRVLDIAAFGPALPDPDADDPHAGATAGPRTVLVDGANADPTTARTTYRDLAGWIAQGWAQGLASCNADKAAIRRLGEGE